MTWGRMASLRDPVTWTTKTASRCWAFARLGVVHLTRGDSYQQSWQGDVFADLPGVRTEAPAEQGPEHHGVADSWPAAKSCSRGKGSWGVGGFSGWSCPCGSSR